MSLHEQYLENLRKENKRLKDENQKLNDRVVEFERILGDKEKSKPQTYKFEGDIEKILKEINLLGFFTPFKNNQ